MSTLAVEAPPLAARRRRWRRRVVLLVVLIALAWFCRFAYLHVTLRPTPRRDYWEAEFAKVDPPPPGAMLPHEVAGLLASVEATASSGSLFTDGFDRIREDLFKGLARGWRTELAESTSPFILGMSSSWNQGSRIEYLRCSEKILQHADGAYSVALATGSTGATRSVVKDWQIALRLAREAARRRQLDAIDAAAQIDVAVARRMQNAARGGMTGLDLQKLVQEVNADRVCVDRPSLYFEGERLALHRQLEEFYVREGGDWMDVSEAVCRSRFRSWSGWSQSAPPLRWWNLTSPLFENLAEARQRVDGQFQAIDTCTSLGVIWRLVGKHDSPSYDYGSALNANVSFQNDLAAMVLRNWYIASTALDAALTMLALHAYRNQHGEFPTRLEQLVPDFLPRLPVDYGDLQTLRYQRKGESYLLYSAGIDGEDGGGELPNDRSWQEGDLIFHMSAAEEDQP